jgi:hypothetical protein
MKLGFMDSGITKGDFRPKQLQMGDADCYDRIAC